MISKKYLEFDVLAVSASGYIRQHWQALCIVETQKALMLIAFGEWTTLYYQYTDENSRTPVVVAEIAAQYKQLKAMLDAMAAQIKADASLDLSPEIRHALGIKPRQPQHHAARGEAGPTAEALVFDTM